MEQNKPNEASAPLLPVDPDVVDAILQEAAQAHERGQIEAARAGYEKALSMEPDHPDALHLLGVIALQERDFARALELIGQAVALDPDMPMALSNLGVAHLESKQPEQALVFYDRALALDPSYVDAHFNRGAALLVLKRWAEAIDSFDRTLALQPGHVEALYCRGNACLGLERFAPALADFDRAIAAKPTHAAAHLNRGNALMALHRNAEALASYDRAIALQPDGALAYVNRGDACQALHRLDDAIACYDQAIARQPDSASAHSNRGNALLALGRTDEAIASYERALAVAPGNPAVLANLGGALRDAQRWDEAVKRCDQALAVDPHHAEAWMNRGNALLDQARLDEAGAAFDKVIALRPEHADAHWARGLCHLLQGDLARGWPHFEWRWKLAGITARQLDRPEPLWLGEQDLRGRTILLHAEQGLGDTIQFCRYAPLLKARGARVVLEVQPSLKPLLTSLDGVDRLVARGEEPLPAFDVHCPLLSLPLAMKTTLETMPAPSAYLTIDPQRASAWAARLGPRAAPRVGLVWSGNAAHRNDRYRSIALERLLAAVPPEVSVYSLQKELRGPDEQTLKASARLTHFGTALHDFADTAALAAQMDLVISVDTSVAHLAAALGKPTWILQPFMPDWRWMLGRNDSPWYPSVRLFRQRKLGDWDAPLQELAQTIRPQLSRGQ